MPMGCPSDAWMDWWFKLGFLLAVWTLVVAAMVGVAFLLLAIVFGGEEKG